MVALPSLIGQRKEEFEKNAPHLNVFVYDGWSKTIILIIIRHEVDLKNGFKTRN